MLANPLENGAESYTDDHSPEGGGGQWADQRVGLTPTENGSLGGEKQTCEGPGDMGAEKAEGYDTLRWPLERVEEWAVRAGGFGLVSGGGSGGGGGGPKKGMIRRAYPARMPWSKAWGHGAQRGQPLCCR